MYKVPEMDDKNYEVRQEHDRAFVDEVCSKVFQMNLADDDVLNLFRLGKKQDGAAARPLLVSFKAEDKKSTVMKNLKKLKTAEDRLRFVGIAHGLTVKQRDESRRLVNEARKRQDDTGDSSENYKFFCGGPFHQTQSHQSIKALKANECCKIGGIMDIAKCDSETGSIVADDNVDLRVNSDGEKPVPKRSSVNQRRKLLCLCLNARSVVNKFDEFSASVQQSVDPDVIGVTESWANDMIYDSELELPGYRLFQHDRPSNNHGGGVLLYIKS
jgi:hypothetical protein